MRSLKILLAAPRGFCAGVDRAIQIVEKTLLKHGAPVYVRHEIVHNKFVVDTLTQKGAVFVEELDEVPSGCPVIFSAHGVPKSVPETAKSLQLVYFDATCPLVSKVHREVEYHHEAGRLVLLIGHKGHPEVIGTMGQVPDGAVRLIETVADVAALSADDLTADTPLAYATQTTLSVDEVADIVAALTQRFPHIIGPRKDDICYATTNRQLAVKTIAPQVDAMIIIGAPNSSNSRRLVEVAQNYGCPKAMLYQRAHEIDWPLFSDVKTLGLSAGASAPETLVDEVIAAFQERFDVTCQEIGESAETVHFNLPKALRDVA